MLKKIIFAIIVMILFINIVIPVKLVPAKAGTGIHSAAFAAEPGSQEDPVVTKSYIESFYKWQNVNLKAGQTATTDLSVELVALSGETEVISGELIDLTAAQVLKPGDIIPLNHLILSPRSDGRGIKATRDSEILIKGLIK